MKQKVIKDYSKEQTQNFVNTIISKHYVCEKPSVKYIGGGSFGYVYKVEIPVSPYKLIVKACRVSGMHISEANALNLLGNDTLIHIPTVYFTVDAGDEIPMDFIVEEYVNGTDCFTDFKKLFLTKRTKQKFANNIVDALAQYYKRKIRQY